MCKKLMRVRGLLRIPFSMLAHHSRKIACGRSAEGLGTYKFVGTDHMRYSRISWSLFLGYIELSRELFERYLI